MTRTTPTTGSSHLLPCPDCGSYTHRAPCPFVAPDGPLDPSWGEQVGPVQEAGATGPADAPASCVIDASPVRAYCCFCESPSEFILGACGTCRTNGSREAADAEHLANLKIMDAARAQATWEREHPVHTCEGPIPAVWHGEAAPTCKHGWVGEGDCGSCEQDFADAESHWHNAISLPELNHHTDQEVVTMTDDDAPRCPHGVYLEDGGCYDCARDSAQRAMAKQFEADAKELLLDVTNAERILLDHPDTERKLLLEAAALVAESISRPSRNALLLYLSLAPASSLYRYYGELHTHRSLGWIEEHALHMIAWQPKPIYPS